MRNFSYLHTKGQKEVLKKLPTYVSTRPQRKSFGLQWHFASAYENVCKSDAEGLHVRFSKRCICATGRALVVEGGEGGVSYIYNAF